MNILQINSSARSQGSESTRWANALSARLLQQYPHATLELRDLAQDPHPILDEAALQAIFTPPAQRSPEQAARVALDDALIAQVQRADVLVLGSPMYNFGITVQLKSWFDAIARAGVTFRYGENGPQGLLSGKKVYVALARGGMHKGLPLDIQTSHIQTFLAFLGMSDVQFIYAEGLNMGPDAAQRAQQQAAEEVAAALV
ncbi:NAD(P)H-dependent oxidoreductase [Massilia sp. W12]|uniref:FMN-dependent NADH-azoreductase n=1 Tax=Massilia sp. W12 TaxID=3126507 RepID=UPI0030D3D8B6